MRPRQRGDGGNGTSFNSEKRRNGGERNRQRTARQVPPMPPRVRGGRWSDTPRTQAALLSYRGLCPRGIARSLGPADGRAGIGSEPEFVRELRDLRVSVSPS